MIPGGKGLLQGLAAARLGASATIIGAVGDDSHGELVRSSLEDEHIATKHLAVVPGETRLNLAAVDATGDVAFVQLPSERPAMLEPDWVSRFQDEIRRADVVLLSLEPTRQVVETALDILADPKGSRPLVYLNPAPAHFIGEKLSERAVASCDLLIPNYLEAVAIIKSHSPKARLPAHPTVRSLELIAKRLLRLGIERGCVTGGACGAMYFQADGLHHEPGFPVSEPVDTIGASDAFIAALALEEHAGRDAPSALMAASAAAAHSVTVLGGASGMPTVLEMQAVLATQRRPSLRRDRIISSTRS
jgi:ribokinase